jgi:spermidine synthase
VELALRTLPRRVAGEPVRMGVIGLGVGTLAAWARPGDTVRFYEIDPAAERLAREYFGFLAASPARVDVILGDGRISLERDLAHSGGAPLFDVLVVDAFAGDAVPVHLLTRECGALYRSAVGPDGVVVFQITNRHVDLGRVVRGLAAATDMQAVRVDQAPVPGRGALPNAWMVLAPRGTPLAARLVAAAPREDRVDAGPGARTPVLWTDDFSNLLRVLR